MAKDARSSSAPTSIRGRTPPSSQLAKLAPVFPQVEGHPGIITAGTASGITDGGAALVLMSAQAAAAAGVTPMARVIGWASAGVDPRVMGIGPVPAMRQLFARTGLTLRDFDLVELNEAFAAQVLAVLRDEPIPAAKLNVNGGAIALGHPIGATGARILVTLLYELIRRQATTRPGDALRQRRHGHGRRHRAGLTADGRIADRG